MPRSLYGPVFIVLSLLLATPPAAADIMPPGQRRIPVAHHLSGVADLAGYQLRLVTRNHQSRTENISRRPVGDGALAVPSGYMNNSFLVALTPAQVEELAQARKRSPFGAGKRFLETHSDLPRSETLPFRTYVADRSPAQREVRKHEVLGVKDGKLQLETLSAVRYDDAGKKVSQAGRTWLPVGLAGGGALLLLLLVGWRRDEAAALGERDGL